MKTFKKIFKVLIIFLIIFFLSTNMVLAVPVDDETTDSEDSLIDLTTDSVTSGKSSALKDIFGSGPIGTLLATVVRLVEILFSGWALIKLVYLGILYFTKSAISPPDDIKKMKARIVNHVIACVFVFGGEAILELLINVFGSGS